MAGVKSALALLLLATSACGGPSGSPGANDNATGTSDVVTTEAVTATTVVAPTTSTPAPTAPPTSTTVPATSLSVFAGSYVGSTGGSGGASIKEDGSGRFDSPDLTACPSCSNASAPRANIDFKLTAAVATASGGYRGTGVITALSNPAHAAAIGAGAVGATVEAVLTPAGALTLSFLRPENVLMRIGGAASTATPASMRTDTGPDAFVSPSKNIGCRISQTSARCDISQHDWPAPPKPATCNLDWGFALGVSGQGAGQFRCAGDTAIGGVTTVLPYGSVARRGPFECRSGEEGMECVNLDTGHGIFVSRGEYRLS
jgi:hypothetical protein